VFDATDRRQYEKELLQARRAAERATLVERAAREESERANRAKDEFLALVSHELRTPLSAILGWSQILRKRNTDNPDIERGLDIIERNTRLQVRLVDDLLDMSRIISGKIRLDVQRVDLANVVEAALEIARPAAQARGVQLQSILDSSVMVSGDPGRLQQVFWNLLSNAVKFTPKGGSVRVVMERVNSHIEVSVVDTGQGMSPELIAHVFERFRQSASVDIHRTGGLGLGLSLVKNLVEMHGGSVAASSAGENQGAQFVVQLPVVVISCESEPGVHPQAALVSATDVPVAIDLSGVRVLLADDDESAREAMTSLLSAQGAQVEAVASASEAVQAVGTFRPDVLVSDIGMPGEDGYELIRKVRMLGEGGRTPAIALTAFSRLEDRTRAMLAGFQSHLSKPVDARELLVTVASLTGRIGGPQRG
jgi:CheY-like chemotaxis protein